MYTNVQTEDYYQLTDMLAPDQFKHTSYVPIVCKINPNSSHAVHHKSYNKKTTHVMQKNAFKISVSISMVSPMNESMLIPKLLSLTC